MDQLGLPDFYLVRQNFPSRRIEDIPARVHAELTKARLADTVPAGSEIAIGVGSRGIANIDTIAASVAAWWRERGMRPFLFPAMGSHGAATAAGQAAVLAKYGITEAAMGCPVRSSLAVAHMGLTPDGIPVVMDRLAWRSGRVFLLGRVKWHTDFSGRLESGLFKMMAIGLGKLAGAQRYHAAAWRMGLEQVILSVGRHLLASDRILGGLAILEDEHHQTAQLSALRSEEMEEGEAELLRIVKDWMPCLPPGRYDLLMLNLMGKDISGSGMDTKIINRSVYGPVNPWPFAPHFDRIYVRDLSPASYGNAIGMGMADVVHARLLRKVKRRPTYVNSLTSCSLPCIATPISFKSDRKVFESIWRTTGRSSAADLRIAWARNTQDLTILALSANLGTEIAANPLLEVLSGPRPLEFDPRGDLVDWLA
jgi:hypothetical protein